MVPATRADHSQQEIHLLVHAPPDEICAEPSRRRSNVRELPAEVDADLELEPGRGVGFDVGGDFEIDDAVNLIELHAFDELRQVGGTARVSGNERLVHLDSLFELESIGGSLIIVANENLGDLDELARLTTVGGNLTIRLNYSLEPALAYALLDRLLAHGFSGEVDIFRNGDADDGHD